MISSRYIHLPKNFINSLFLIAEQYSIVQMYHIFCIHSSVEGHLGSFQLLAIINRAAMNIVEHVSLLSVGSSGYLPRRGITGSSGRTMSSFLRNHQTDFQSGCTSWQSHQQWRNSSYSTSLQISAVTRVFDLSYSDWCEVESQGCFDLHFADD